MGIKTPNKLINQYFLCEPDIFTYVMEYFNATSDMSFAYIPRKDSADINLNRENGRKGNDHYIMSFEKKSASNGFADLGIGYLNKDNKSKNKFIKVIHINSLHRFNIDSSFFTFGEDKENLYYVIYSDVEYCKAEYNRRFAIIPATTMYNFFETLNMATNNQTIDLITMEKTLKVLGRYDIIYPVDGHIDMLKEGTKTNILLKLKSCMETLNSAWYRSTDGENLGEAFSRTHYGKQYTMFNLTQGKIFNFRDAVAVKNFCRNYNITDLDSKEISKKCRFQEKMIEGETPDRYSANIYTDKNNNEDWIILSRQKDNEEDAIEDNFTLVEKIKTILLALYENSARWTKRLNSKLKVFLSNIDKFIGHLKKMFFKIMNKVVSTLLEEDFSPDYILKNLRFVRLLKTTPPVIQQ